MNLNLDSAQLSSEQLPELVRQLVADNVRLRAEIEELKRKNARSAATFSKNKRQKNLQLPGRKAGQGLFSNHTAPLEEHYTGPIEDGPVTSPVCSDCGGELTGESEVSWHLRPHQLIDRDNQRLPNELGRDHERGNLMRVLHELVMVEPTNNAAKRALRLVVIACKVSQCSKNEGGAAAYSAFKSVIGTLKKSGCDVLEELTGLIAPSLQQQPASAITS